MSLLPKRIHFSQDFWNQNVSSWKRIDYQSWSNLSWRIRKEIGSILSRLLWIPFNLKSMGWYGSKHSEQVIPKVFSSRKDRASIKTQNAPRPSTPINHDSYTLWHWVNDLDNERKIMQNQLPNVVGVMAISILYNNTLVWEKLVWVSKIKTKIGLFLFLLISK